MKDGIMLTIGADGKAAVYDDTYDIVIHCESQEEQDRVRRLLENIPRWTPCNEKKPETMPKTNEDVLLQFSSNMGVGFYQDGWAVNTGEGIYSTVDMSEEKPIAWMPLPDPYGGEDNAT